MKYLIRLFKSFPILSFSSGLLYIILSFTHPCFASPTPKVLVLHSYHKGLSWTDSLVKGVDDGLNKYHRNIDISHEFMDTKKMYSDSYLHQLFELYKAKFKDSELSLIISTDDHAFQFLLQYHGELFPGVPVVFCGVNNFQPAMLENKSLFTGVTEDIDIGETLGIVFSLHPKVSRFVVVGDQSLTGKANKKRFLAAVENVSRQIDIVFLDNHTMGEVRSEVAQLKIGDVAFWLTFTADRAGNYFSFRESATLISEVSKAPLYSFWDFHLGYGTIGGRLASGYYQGMAAAEVGVKVLDGQPVSTISVETESPNKFMFDYNQLKRFGVDPTLLPPGSVVINEPQTLYSQYKNSILVIGLGFIVLSLTIVLLLFSAHQKKVSNREIILAKNRYQRIFDDTAVGLFEADLTLVYDLVLALRRKESSRHGIFSAEDEKKLYTIARGIEIIDCNQAAMAIFGTSGKEELLAHLNKDVQFFDENSISEQLLVLFKQQDMSHVEWEVIKENFQGELIYLLISIQPTLSNGGKSKVIISAVDITKRRRILEALRESESRFRALFNTAASGIGIMTTEGRYIRVNDALSEMLGYPKEEIEKHDWKHFTHPSDLKKGENIWQELLEGGSVQPIEKRYIDINRQTIWVLLQLGINKDESGRPVHFVAQIQNITEMKKAQARMRLKDARYREIFEADLTGFFIANPSGKILLCNQVLAEILGFEKIPEVIGKNISPYYRNSDEWAQLVGKLWDKQKIENYEFELLRGTGQSFTVLFSGVGRFDEYDQLVEIQGHMLDISRQKKLENQLVRAQKMEAIGLMAGGVAHDLNNILSGIINYPELMLAALEEDHKLRDPLESIKESGQRAAAVVADLLTVARSAANVREVHNLQTLAKEYLASPECKRLSSLYPNISVQLEPEEMEGLILCSPVHVKKSLMNLVTNAMEAIEDSGEVKITIKEQILEEKTGEEFTQQKYVLLHVHDNGPGIDEKDRERIFEPFYTKKVMGRSGTGLGLAVVWNTVQDHGGKIIVESDKSGTLFSLYFPKYEKLQIAPAQQKEVVNFKGWGEHILVVDDEPVLRDIAFQILTILGYKVDAVNSGEAAIAFLQDTSVDLVLLDMFMEPGINGRETYERILLSQPNQKAIIASGFSKSDDVSEAMKLGVGAFIKKPYTIEQLGKVVFEELYGKEVS